MQDEYRVLINNRTSTLTFLLLGTNIVGCKWIFKNKYNANGTFQRHKARLVAKGDKCQCVVFMIEKIEHFGTKLLLNVRKLP